MFGVDIVPLDLLDFSYSTWKILRFPFTVPISPPVTLTIRDDKRHRLCFLACFSCSHGEADCSHDYPVLNNSSAPRIILTKV